MPKTAHRPNPIVPHLQRDRHGSFYFRLTIDGCTMRRSLRTKDRNLATMLASKLNWEWAMAKRGGEPSISEITTAFNKEGRRFDAEFPDGTKLTGINSDDDLRRAKELMLARIDAIDAIGPIEPELRELLPAPRKSQAQTAPQAAPFKGKGKRFLAVSKSYLEELASDDLNVTKTLDDKESTYAAFAKQFNDPMVHEITKEMAVAFKDEARKTARSIRVNTKIGQMSELMRWAIGHGYAEANPFDGTRISNKSKLAQKVESYERFSEDDLKLIFNPATYPAYATKTKHHFKWLPFLLLYTGARPDELASLRVDEVCNEKGIDYFDITRGKTTQSVRKIPLHHVVLASGFMDYVKLRRSEDPKGQLFPMLKPSKNGYAKNVSRRFNETYLEQLRIDNPRKRLYSMRATFITQMTELNVHPAMLMALVGHFEQEAVDLSSPHFKNYQGAKLLTALKKTIDLFDITLPLKL